MTRQAGWSKEWWEVVCGEDFFRVLYQSQRSNFVTAMCLGHFHFPGKFTREMKMLVGCYANYSLQVIHEEGIPGAPLPVAQSGRVSET